MPDIANLTSLANDDLLVRLKALVQREQTLLAELLAHLAEVDARRLYLGEAAPSLFAYCVEVLHYSEDAAYKRIQAARAARAYPLIFERVTRGELHLSAITLLAAHLTADNHRELLALACHKSKRQVEELLATRFPQADAVECLRRLPSAPSAAALPMPAPRTVSPALGLPYESTAGEPRSSLPIDTPASTSALVPEAPGGLRAPAPAPAPAPRADLTPLSADRYRLQVTLSAATRDKLLRARELLRHRLPDGDLARVLDLALSELVDGLEQRKFGKLKQSCRRPADSEPPRGVPGAAGLAPGQATRGAEPHPVAPATGLDAPRSPSAPSPSRVIPRALRRAVAERDNYQCTFVTPDGRRCSARGRLEFHHVVPHARGGPPTLANLRLACRMHNNHQAVLDFGAQSVRRGIEARRRQRRAVHDSRPHP